MRGMPEVYWYPSIGNKGYPYTTWEWKNREYAWNTLSSLTNAYHGICRILRKAYKWSPDVVDSLTIDRIWRIYEETIEDAENDQIQHEDFD